MQCNGRRGRHIRARQIKSRSTDFTVSHLPLLFNYHKQQQSFWIRYIAESLNAEKQLLQYLSCGAGWHKMARSEHLKHAIRLTSSFGSFKHISCIPRVLYAQQQPCSCNEHCAYHAASPPSTALQPARMHTSFITSARYFQGLQFFYVFYARYAIRTKLPLGASHLSPTPPPPIYARDGPSVQHS